MKTKFKFFLFVVLAFASGAYARGISISSLSFSGVAPVSATLSLDAGTPNVTNVIALCWDTAERGADFSAWANHRYLAYAPPETTSVTLAFPDAVTDGWNASVRAARFFLVDGTPYIPDASAYVSDGLLAHFDGLENVAYGTAHSNAATKWTDLTGHGYNWTLGSICSWQDNALHFSGSGTGGSNSKSSAADWSIVRTMEMVYKPELLQGVIFSSPINNALYSYILEGKISVTRSWGCPISLDGVPHSVAAVYEDGDLEPNTGTFSGQMYFDGNPIQAKKIGDYWNNGSAVAIGNRRGGGGTGAGSRSKGSLFALRFYNRQLSAVEIAANHAIDAIRYMGAISLSDVTALGATDPVHPSDAPVAITAAPNDPALGSVTASSATYHYGDTVTLTATPIGDYSQFLRWEGDIPDGVDAASSSISFVADRDRALTAYFANVSVLYVATDGNDATAEPNNPEKPYATLAAAYGAALDDNVISIGPGDFPLSAAIAVDKDVTFRGAGSNETFVTSATTTERAFVLSSPHAVLRDLAIVGFTNSVNTQGSAVYMSNGLIERCRLAWHSVTIREPLGVALHMSGGTVRGCTFDHNTVKQSAGKRCGDSIYMTGGLVEDTVVRDCVKASENHASSFHMTGGTARRCVVIDCIVTPGPSASTVGALYMSGGTFDQGLVSGCGSVGVYLGAGSLQNSVVTGCRNSLTSVCGVRQSGGSMLHCTITDNVSEFDDRGRSGLHMTGGTAVGNIVWGNGVGNGGVFVDGGVFNTNVIDKAVSAGVGNLVADPLFANAAGGDYSLRIGSPAIDAGLATWAVAHDFAGVQRPQGRKPDLGAFERVPGASFAVGIVTTSSACPSDGGITFSATYEGGEATSLAWYLDGAQTPAGEGTSFTASGLASGHHTVRIAAEDGAGATAGAEAVFDVLPVKTFAATDGSDEWPYETPEKAARSIADALGAVWKDTSRTTDVEVAAGTYEISSSLSIANPVRLAGAGAGATILTQSGTADRALSISHRGAEVSGVTVRGFANGLDGAGVRLYYGTMRDSTIENCNVKGVMQPKGGGAYISGGRLLRVAFTGNTVNNSSNTRYGGAIYMTGGIAEDCDIVGNASNTDNDNGRGSIYMTGGTLLLCRVSGNYAKTSNASGQAIVMEASGALVDRCMVTGNMPGGIRMTAGTIRNTLVTDNGNPGSLVAGVVMSGGTLINCTVAGNVATNATAIGRGLAMSAGRAVNNIVWGNSAAGSEYSGISITGGTFNTNLVESAVSQGTGNFVAHPRFRRPGANYILRSVSPAINAGDNGVWASLSEVTDITGRPRLATAKDRVDLGCYECDKTIATYLVFE